MTKSKPVAPKPKPKPIKPVLAWCCADDNGNLWPGWTRSTRADLLWDEPWHSGAPRIVRVEIRPAPKRGGAKP